jgi:hypothetical protein
VFSVRTEITMSLLLATARDQGTSAFIYGTPRCANPHLPDTAEHTGWDGGWRQAESITTRLKAPLNPRSIAEEVEQHLEGGATVHVIASGRVVATYAPGPHGPVRLTDTVALQH